MHSEPTAPRWWNRSALPPYATALLAALAFLAVVLCASCACWDAAHKDEPACRAASSAIDCTAKNVADKIPMFYPIVAYILSGASSHPDWMTMLQTLELAGLGAVACTAEQVRADAIARAPGTTAPTPGTSKPMGWQAPQPAAVSAADEYIRTRGFKFTKLPAAAAVDGGAR